jgi:hypothetical protein
VSILLSRHGAARALLHCWTASKSTDSVPRNEYIRTRFLSTLYTSSLIQVLYRSWDGRESGEAKAFLDRNMTVVPWTKKNTTKLMLPAVATVPAVANVGSAITGRYD